MRIAAGVTELAHDHFAVGRLVDAPNELLAPAQRVGAIRPEVTAHDVNALIGAATSADEPGGDPDHLLTVVLDGSGRAPKSPSATVACPDNVLTRR